MPDFIGLTGERFFNHKPYGTGAWHLYNLADDPGETRDLSKDEPETLKQLQNAWDRYAYAEDVGVILTQ